MFNRKSGSEDFNGFLADGTSLCGDLQFSGKLHLDGNVRGSITTNDVLIIGENATVEADIEAGEVQVFGTVIGNVTCATRIEISKSGRLRGDVRTPHLVIEEGGVFEGNSLAANSAERSHQLPEDVWKGDSKPMDSGALTIKYRKRATKPSVASLPLRVPPTPA